MSSACAGKALSKLKQEIPSSNLSYSLYIHQCAIPVNKKHTLVNWYRGLGGKVEWVAMSTIHVVAE